MRRIMSAWEQRFQGGQSMETCIPPVPRDRHAEPPAPARRLRPHARLPAKPRRDPSARAGHGGMGGR